jgi:hypothetical protein
MPLTAYYVYALKDPRGPFVRPFYVGKGTGIRREGHLLQPDQTPKGIRIRAIQATGCKPIITVLADELTEVQALKLEAELIAALGTEATGGLLTNRVIPSGNPPKVRHDLIVPTGVREKAQLGLSFLMDSVFELAESNPNGITNADATKALGLQSDYKGGSKDYLVWSLLGLLMRERRLQRVNRGRKGYHVANC